MDNYDIVHKVHGPNGYVKDPNNPFGILHKAKRFANKLETSTGYIHQVHRIDSGKHVVTYHPNWDYVRGDNSNWEKIKHVDESIEQIEELSLSVPDRTPTGIPKKMADAHRNAVKNAVDSIKYFAREKHRGDHGKAYSEWEKGTTFGPDLKKAVRSGVGLKEDVLAEYGIYLSEPKKMQYIGPTTKKFQHGQVVHIVKTLGKNTFKAHNGSQNYLVTRDQLNDINESELEENQLPLDEISYHTADSYINKAATDKNRSRGVELALKKRLGGAKVLTSGITRKLLNPGQYRQVDKDTWHAKDHNGKAKAFDTEAEAIKHAQLKEDVEQIDELNIDTLVSYAKKSKLDSESRIGASQSERQYAQNSALDGDFEGAKFHRKRENEQLFKAGKRGMGHDLAVDKIARLARVSNNIRSTPIKEEQIDELSTGTLKSYKKKAEKSFNKLDWENSKILNSRDDFDDISPNELDKVDGNFHTMGNRRRGFRLATKKINKEPSVKVYATESNDDGENFETPNQMKMYLDHLLNINMSDDTMDQDVESFTDFMKRKSKQFKFDYKPTKI